MDMLYRYSRESSMDVCTRGPRGAEKQHQHRLQLYRDSGDASNAKCATWRSLSRKRQRKQQRAAAEGTAPLSQMTDMRPLQEEIWRKHPHAQCRSRVGIVCPSVGCKRKLTTSGHGGGVDAGRQGALGNGITRVPSPRSVYDGASRDN